jgi:hypothetical protein
MSAILSNAIALLLAGLIFVWPVEHTIALRYVLSALLLVSVVCWWWPLRRDILPWLKAPPIALTCLLLMALTLWFVVQALFIAPEAHWIWLELRGQWIKDLLFWCLGLSLGVGYQLRSETFLARRWLLALLLGLVGIVLWNVFVCLWLWLVTGDMPLMHSVTGARATDSYVNNMLLAFLVGDLLSRDLGRKFLPWGRYVSIMLIGFCVINTAFIGARNGWIGLGMLVFSGVVVHYINGWQRVGKKALMFLPVLLALLLAGAWTSWKTDPRWNSLKETLPIAWDIDTHKAWLNATQHPYPTLPNGQQVDGSNYERPAWIHAGIRLVLDRPLGAGFSRHAFGHEVARLYPESKPSPGMHSHSGIIDFAVGVGIPGVILWLGFVITLIGFGGVAYFRYGAAAGLVLVFLTSGFFGRSLLDSSMRDHMLEEFLFVSAFLLPVVGQYWQKRRS